MYSQYGFPADEYKTKKTYLAALLALLILAGNIRTVFFVLR
jgi:hypothetical protein